MGSDCRLSGLLLRTQKYLARWGGAFRVVMGQGRDISNRPFTLRDRTNRRTQKEKKEDRTKPQFYEDTEFFIALFN